MTNHRKVKRKRGGANRAKVGCIIVMINALCYRKTKNNVHSGTETQCIQKETKMGETKNDGERGPNNTIDTVTKAATAQRLN